MEFERSSLWRDVQRVTTSRQKPVNFVYSARIHTGEGTYSALKVLNIDYIENFMENYSPEIHLEVLLPIGTYAKRILPNKETLEITLTRIPVDEIGVSIDTTQDLTSIRYKASMITIENFILEDGAGFEADEQTLNISNFDKIKFQLVDKMMEQLRLENTGTVFRYSTVENAIKTVLGNVANQLNLDGEQIPIGIDMVPADNQKERAHIVIPQGIAAIDVPDYIQKNCGVYSTGLSQYIKDRYWYVYPTFDAVRFSQTLRTMNVILIPQNKLPGIERTYVKEGDCLTVLCTSERKYTNKSESLQLVRGNGTQFADASKILGGFVSTKDGRALLSRGANNNEYVANQRLDNQNNVRVSDKPFTINIFEENSKLFSRQGNYFQFLWENSNPDLVLPGTMVRISYMDDEIVTIEGVIVAAHHFVQMSGQGVSAGRYYSNSGIVAYINNQY